jgi:3'(2'), 5'-bisphosphate nucleotidase
MSIVLSALTQKLIDNPKALLNRVRRVAAQAGDICLAHFDESGSMAHDKKEDGSPVSIADRESEIFLLKEIALITPDIPIISEEAAARGDVPPLADHGYVWFVDPLDGTRQFVSGSPDFSVNIALVKDKRPVLGIIYFPVSGEAYSACGKGTATIWHEDTDSEKSIHARRAPADGLVVLSGLSKSETDALQRIYEQLKVSKRTARGGTVKHCLVACGKADFYIRRGPTCFWDTAAGDIILESAGGGMCDFQGNKLVYDPAGGPDFENPFFFIYGDPDFAEALLSEKVFDPVA